ncbi:MAG: hypothetical protein WA842_03840 [Croceibacterium sp.]
MLAMLSACGQDEAPVQVERFSLDAARHVAGPPMTSPDTADAAWTVSKDGQAVHFGKAGAPPLMTLACKLKEQPAQLVVIRHVPARPGLKAMFPVIGSGRISRFKVDATLSGSEWRWQGALPAADELNDVFTGMTELEATLPGGGSLIMAPSRIPGEFVTWCRASGHTQAPTPEVTPTPSPVPTPEPTPRP